MVPELNKTQAATSWLCRPVRSNGGMGCPPCKKVVENCQARPGQILGTPAYIKERFSYRSLPRTLIERQDSVGVEGVDGLQCILHFRSAAFVDDHKRGLRKGQVMFELIFGSEMICTAFLEERSASLA